MEGVRDEFITLKMHICAHHIFEQNILETTNDNFFLKNDHYNSTNRSASSLIDSRREYIYFLLSLSFFIFLEKYIFYLASNTFTLDSINMAQTLSSKPRN